MVSEQLRNESEEVLRAAQMPNLLCFNPRMGRRRCTLGNISWYIKYEGCETRRELKGRRSLVR